MSRLVGQFRRLFAVAIIALGSFAAIAPVLPANAQFSSAPSKDGAKDQVRRLLERGTLDKAQINALIAKLSDTDLRGLLLDYLNT